MSDQLARPWVQTRPPHGSGCRSWSPQHVRELPGIRRQFRSWVASAEPHSPGLRENRIEESVLALDELMSNALRHGRAPVDVEVCSSDGGLLLSVADRAAEDPPRPTATRDPSDGGMGLGMIADFALEFGWYPHDDRKVVWAVMPSHES